MNVHSEMKNAETSPEPETSSPGQPDPRWDAPRVVMLSRSVPGTSDTGGRYLQSFIDLLPRGALAFFCVTAPENFGLTSSLSWLPIGFAPDPAPRAPAAGASEAQEVARTAAWDAALFVHSRDIARNAVQFAHDRGATRIVVLMAPLFSRVVREIRALSSIPVSLVVSDPPDYQSRTIPARFHRMLMDDFAQAQRIADRCASISEAMAETHEKTFGHRPIVLRHAIADASQRPGRQALRSDGALTIALVGGMYAADAIEAFIGALAGTGWTIGSRRVSLIALTRRLPPGAHQSMPIDHRGWIDQDEAIDILAQADLGYVAYWFGEPFRSAVRQSFPSKLSTFAAAGLPVFFHGPEPSSVTRFLRSHPMGVACASLDPSDILAALRDFVAVPGRFAAAGAAAEAAFTAEMSHTVFRARLMELLALPA